jgi:hypothetical protein
MIIDLVRLLSILKNTSTLEHGEMLGDCGLVRSHQLGQIVDTKIFFF